ncbi:MAG: D-alanyl-D-alanine carboxypeptidase [bacterium]
MMRRLIQSFFTFVFLLLPASAFTQNLPAWGSQVTQWIQNGGVYAEGANGKTLFDYQGNTSFMPASTLKLVTGLASLELLGKDYRFKTDFYMDHAGNLYVKGYGDPYLVSEELDQISGLLKSKGVKNVAAIILDPSYFEEIKVPGVSASLNPYDALNSALSANFNTIFVNKKGAQVESAEAQTPMTDLTRTLAEKAPQGKSRINLAAHPDESLLYVGHLLKAFLEVQGIKVSGPVQKGLVKGDARLIYQHVSSKSLEQVVQAMMKYSTNFIANQLFLTIGAEKMGPPASLAKGKKVVTEFLKTKLNLTDFNIEEGSGISRQNKITPYQLVKVLRAFEKYKNLLPEKLDNILAKTGTLNGVSCLAGFFNSGPHQEVRFSILLNQNQGNREKVARALYDNLH